SGTQPATTNDDDYTKSPYYVEIAMYLYLVWTPSIRYFKEEIFEKYIPSYLEEWTLKGKITNNRIQEQFLNQKIFEEYKTPYDSDEQNNSAEKPNYL
ncbi:2630_t:CDS:2, partial [Dentiscutata erythropus]